MTARFDKKEEEDVSVFSRLVFFALEYTYEDI
jgi:hypothetical protein